APHLATTAVLGVVAFVDVLRPARDGEFGAPGNTALGRRGLEPIRDRRGHGADHPHPRRPVRVLGPVEREPELVAVNEYAGRRVVDRESVGPDRAVVVALSVHRRAP